MFLNENFIKIDTPNTSLIFRRYSELLEIAYYGGRVADMDDYTIVSGHKRKYARSCSDDVITGNTTVCCYGMGCDRHFSVAIKNYDGGIANKFLFERAEKVEKPIIEGLPSSRDGKETLMLVYRDRDYDIELRQYYTVFDDTDVIAVSNCIVNDSNQTFSVQKLDSLQMDLDSNGYDIYTYPGTWARERHQQVTNLKIGKFSIGTVGGSSSHAVNPFFMLKRPERMGGYIAFNLEYSGNHRSTVEGAPTCITRVTVGMGDLGLDIKLSSGEKFHTPEAVMTFGNTQNDVTTSMHNFVNNHVIQKKYLKERPLAVNIWEPLGCDFNYDKVIAFADASAKLGAELLIVDDGWFGKRNAPNCSLGDWVDNKEKTGGLDNLSKAVREKGLKFGIWIEPEMINPDSDLYRAHPDWVLGNPKRYQTLMRDQLVLDIAKPEVFDYLYGCFENLMKLCSPDYIKWDYNRVIHDAYQSPELNGENYSLEYIKALYRLMDKILTNYPALMIEGCAAGGGRYDLGMFHYVPQIWTSDMTDPVERAHIQEGTLVGYPQSTMSAHVASAVSHAGRNTRLRDRFAVSLEGVFGYECDITKLSEEQTEEVKQQIAFYKKHRNTLLYGDYKLIESYTLGEGVVSITVSKDKSTAIAKIFRLKQTFDREPVKYKFDGLDRNATYKVGFFGREEKLICKGDILCNSGLDLFQYFLLDRKGEYTNEINTLVIEMEKID